MNRSMRIRVKWKFSVRDKSGLLVHEKTELGNSLLMNFVDEIMIGVLNNHPTQVHTGNFVDTGGVARTMASNTNQSMDFTGLTGNNTGGIVLGTGNTPNTTGRFQLDAIIGHGVAAGQLNYGGVLIVDPVPASNPRVWGFSRLFGGNPVSSVTVNEAGVIFFFTTTGFHILMERSIITPFNIPANGACTAVCSIGVSI